MKLKLRLGRTLLGAGLLLVSAFGCAEEQAVASLGQVNGRISVVQDGSPVFGAEGMGLRRGDRATALDNSSAVVQFLNGCRYELKANESVDIDEPTPCCLGGAEDSGSKMPVAAFGRIEGKAMANLGSNYIPAREGLQLKVGDRALALENSTATIAYANGCQHTLLDDEVLEIDSQGPCCAILLPVFPTGGAAAGTAGTSGAAAGTAGAAAGAATVLPPIAIGTALPVIVGGGVAICALADCGGDGGNGGQILPPLPPISP